jgi:hypothetical protein
MEGPESLPHVAGAGELAAVAEVGTDADREA